MGSEGIPTEQWAQVVEKTGGRELPVSLGEAPPTPWLTGSSPRVQKDPGTQAWPR